MKQHLKAFLKSDAAAGVVLMLTAALALIIANSPFLAYYEALRQMPLGPSFFSKTLVHWVNDVLMAVFFFLVGLELKREFLVGSLSGWARATLPAIAALAGMIVPALIYVAINFGDPVALRGWAIPSATDIAFALGVLSLVGSRVPAALKILLLAIAIIDDLGAIIVIALFYTQDLAVDALGAAAICAIGLAILNLAGVRRILPYLLIGALLWYAVLESRVHPTLAGVITALAIPLSDRAETLEHRLRPFVLFCVMPLFGFMNIGVSFASAGLKIFADSVTHGIVWGLFIGKQIGVAGTIWLAIRARIVPMPEGTTMRQVYGMALLTGIGFTMSLFIGDLAFQNGGHSDAVRVGVLAGSLISAVAGFFLLRSSTRD